MNLWKKTFKSLTALILGALSSCAHRGPEAHQIDIVPSQNVKVQVGDTDSKDIKAGETLSVDQPATISAPGYESMIVVPAEAGRASLPLKLVPLQDLKLKDDANAIDPQKEADKLLSDVVRIQSLIAKGKGSEALTLTEETQKNWPRVVFLDYLKASALILQNDTTRATAILEESLAKNPDDKEIKELLTNLKNAK